MNLHHLALQVADLDVARAFYVDVLGMPLVRTQPHALWVQAGPTLLMLERCAGVVDDGAWSSDRCGPFVVAFAIGPPERGPLKQRLQQAGVVVDHESAFTLYVRDPFGARLGFSHYPEPA
jgi:catechol 2,3-dioxygenase-like lactoylglutathione lyase family enzyme